MVQFQKVVVVYGAEIRRGEIFLVVRCGIGWQCSKLRLFPLPETLRYQIKLLLAREIVSQIDTFLDKRASHVAEGLNVQGAIVSKLNQMDLDEIEILVRQVSGRHLGFITWFGGVVGFLIGCVQVLIVLWFG